MTPLAWMIGASASSWGAVAALVEPADATATLGGMAGPLAAVCATWWLVARVHARQASRVTAVMTCAFGVKMVFFGAYVAVRRSRLGSAPPSSLYWSDDQDKPYIMPATFCAGV